MLIVVKEHEDCLSSQNWVSLLDGKKTNVLSHFPRQGAERSQNMTTEVPSLMTVYKGWDGYGVSLVRAIAPLSRDQLIYRPASHLRSAGEIARHISEGRFGWFRRTFGLSSAGDANLVIAWRPEDAIQEQPAELVKGLEATWRMIEDALNRWTVADLAQTYPL